MTSDKILQELYTIDPALRSEEAALKKAINELLANKPDAAMDEKFKHDLKQQLLDRFSTIPLQQNAQFKKHNRAWWVRLAISIGGAAAVLLIGFSIAIPTLRFYGNSRSQYNEATDREYAMKASPSKLIEK